MTTAEIVEVVLEAMRRANLARQLEQQLEVSPDALLFTAGSPLDSLGLVSLLIDVEEAFQDVGHEITLGDSRAMSQTHSPFRSVPALVEYIQATLAETP
jgi:acyl carrier protein